MSCVLRSLSGVNWCCYLLLASYAVGLQYDWKYSEISAGKLTVPAVKVSLLYRKLMFMQQLFAMLCKT